MKVRWTRRALADLNRLSDRIAQDKPLAADEFVRAIADKVARLQEFPLLGRKGAYQDTRELVVHKNYLVTYRVRADEVQALQVWHLARNLPRGA
ncbi:MAG: type II toxin-antitoxin system RelE/ParE family toxin [Rhizobacter sp.]|nr:type II toxin-antitoxin system RelE/ParE family toxin [Rhizobacter sp.]